MKLGKTLRTFIVSLIVAFLLAIVLGGNQYQQTTASTTRALLSESYPVKVLGAQEVSVYVRVEGQDGTIWRGEVTVTESDITADNSGKTYHLSHPTALGALDEASHAGGFPYYVTDAYGALFVSSISGEENQAASGWMYRINYYSPNVGAGEFTLGETVPPELLHKEVLWYYGAGGKPPLKISLSDTEVHAGEEFSAMVTLYDDTARDWSSCKGATVYIDHEVYPDLTDSDGTVSISIEREGNYDIFVEKDGCTRSDKIRVAVTAPVPECHSLILNVSPEDGGTVDLSPSQPAGGYSEGSEVELTANPADGYAFGSWSSDLSGSTNPTTITMSRNRKVTANFVLFDTGGLTNVGLVEADSEVTSISVDSYSIGDLTNVPSNLDPQSAYVVDPEGSGSFSLMFTNISNASDIKAYKVTESDWTKLEDVATSRNAVELTMEVGEPIIAFALSVSEKPASFSASRLNISPETVQPNQQLDISVSVTNVGGEAGSYNAVLYINGNVERSQMVSISPGSTQTVVFSMTKATPGTYIISLAGQQGQFTVVGGQSSDARLDVSSVIAIVIIIALIVGVAFVFRRIRRAT